MKNLRILLVLSIVVSAIIFISSCKKESSTPAPPVASFTYTCSNSSYAPSLVTFTNSSTNASAFIWNFGDGNTSTIQNPQHTYTTGGNFNVQLTAAGAGGSNSVTQSITILLPTDITFSNPVFTDIYITLNNTTLTIPSGGSATFYSVPGSSVSYYAYTYGESTSGTQVGLKIEWNYTIDLSGTPLSYTLDIPSTYFFLYMKNDGTHDLTPLYVNYGLTQQTEDNIVIPDDDVEYNTGYYYAFTNSVIRAYYEDEPSDYTYWQNLPFPWTDDQWIECTNTFKMTPNIDETHKSEVNPQFLKPVGNLKLNKNFDKKAIKVYCK